MRRRRRQRGPRARKKIKVEDNKMFTAPTIPIQSDSWHKHSFSKTRFLVHGEPTSRLRSRLFTSPSGTTVGPRRPRTTVVHKQCRRAWLQQSAELSSLTTTTRSGPLIWNQTLMTPMSAWRYSVTTVFVVCCLLCSTKKKKITDTALISRSDSITASRTSSTDNNR